MESIAMGLDVETNEEAAAAITKEQYPGRLYFAVVAAILAITLIFLF